MKTHQTPREDAVSIGNGPILRDYVPTTDKTIWVETWEEFENVGGRRCWNEDQTEITLSLPVGHKFSTSFERH